MRYFEDVYLERLNRYGTNHQERIQGQRERAFRNYLEKSVYKVEFYYDDYKIIGSLERNKQNNTQLLHYLLVPTDVDIPAGTILFIEDKNGIEKPWLVYWLEEIKASGYNRYIILAMTHQIKWQDENQIWRESWSYMYGQQDSMLKDELRSRGRSSVLYTENSKLNFLIMPVTEHLLKDDYIEITTANIKEAYVVTGYDIQSSEGIMYVSIDPRFIRDHTPLPQEDPDNPDDDDDFFWLHLGGAKED